MKDFGTLPREQLKEFKYCMSCGLEQTVPYNMKIKKDEEFVYISCTGCESQVKHKVFTKRNRDECKCGGKLKVKESKKKGTKHLKKAYYYTHILACVDCSKTYLDNKYKVKN